MKDQLKKERFQMLGLLEKKIQEQIGALCHMNIAEVPPPPAHRIWQIRSQLSLVLAL